MKTITRTCSAIVTSLFLSSVVVAQEGETKNSTPEPKVESKDVKQVGEVEKPKVRQEKIRGVEISVVNSTVQKGVKSPTQVNLEKVLKLLSQPKPKPKPKPAAAAALGGGGKSKPRGGGGGDGRRVVSSPPQPGEGGS